jgi:hypothetical protein
MNDVPLDSPSDEFVDCWRAAGLHIEEQAQGGLRGWIRGHLAPPFLEHLSFRLGNRLFFVRLVDVDARLDTPGSLAGLHRIADGCRGHACLMPMRRGPRGWQPVASGWGLLDARTHRPIDPPSEVTAERIEMTDWELQDFAVQVVRRHLEDQGRELMSWCSDPAVDPSIWFVGDDGPEWVLVRAARYPHDEAPPPANLAAIAQRCSAIAVRGHFASVSFAGVPELADLALHGDADLAFDLEADEDEDAMPLYRGHGADVLFSGLQPVQGLGAGRH